MFWTKTVRNSSLYRFVAVNLFALSLLGAAFHKGWVQAVYLNDNTFITTAMAVLFAIGWSLSLKKIFDLNRVNVDRLTAVNGYTHNSLVHRGVSSIQPIRHIGTMMFLLGITGTVAGLKIALSGVAPDAAQEASKVGPMIGTLIHGMGVKLDSTLMGLILNMWTMSNYLLLSTETQKVIARICEKKGL